MKRLPTLLLLILLSCPLLALEVPLATAPVPPAVAAPMVDADASDLAWKSPATLLGLLQSLPKGRAELHLTCDAERVYLLLSMQGLDGFVPPPAIDLQVGPAPWLTRRVGLAAAGGGVEIQAGSELDVEAAWSERRDGWTLEASFRRSGVAPGTRRPGAGLALRLRCAGGSFQTKGAGLLLDRTMALTSAAVVERGDRPRLRLDLLHWPLDPALPLTLEAWRLQGGAPVVQNLTPQEGVRHLSQAADLPLQPVCVKLTHGDEVHERLIDLREAFPDDDQRLLAQRLDACLPAVVHERLLPLLKALPQAGPGQAGDLLTVLLAAVMPDARIEDPALAGYAAEGDIAAAIDEAAAPLETNVPAWVRAPVLLEEKRRERRKAAVVPADPTALPQWVARLRKYACLARESLLKPGERELLAPVLGEVVRLHADLVGGLLHDRGAVRLPPAVLSDLAATVALLPQLFDVDAEFRILGWLAWRQPGAWMTPTGEPLHEVEGLLGMLETAATLESYAPTSVSPDHRGRARRLLVGMSERVLPDGRIAFAGSSASARAAALVERFALRDPELARFSPEGLVAVPLLTSVPQQSGTFPESGTAVSRCAGGRFSAALLGRRPGLLVAEQSICWGAVELGLPAGLLLQNPAADQATSAPMLLNGEPACPAPADGQGLWLTSALADVGVLPWRTGNGHGKRVTVALKDAHAPALFVYDHARGQGDLELRQHFLRSAEQALCEWHVPDSQREERDLPMAERNARLMALVSRGRDKVSGRLLAVPRLGDGPAPRVQVSAGAPFVLRRDGLTDILATSSDGSVAEADVGQGVRVGLDGDVLVARLEEAGLTRAILIDGRHAWVERAARWEWRFGRRVSATIEIRADGSWAVTVESSPDEVVELEAILRMDGRDAQTKAARLQLPVGKTLVFRPL